MKPIETRYKGYRFRSRLEAKWAVYFDSIGLEWQYEKEGYHLDNHISYLPDFWLPQVKMWAEVKHQEFNADELQKVELLVRSTGFSCVLLIGLPDRKSYDFIELSEDQGLEISDCVISMYHGYPISEKRFYANTGGGLRESNFNEYGLFDDVGYAVDKARAARFEFGEDGT